MQEMSESVSHCDKLLVVAMDIGTTYSGYAFSFKSRPLEIHTNPNWVAGSEKLISLKSPTCVLLKPNQEFHSFGFEAENKFNDLSEDDEHHDWYMFRRFKMALYESKNLTHDLPIEDISGKRMPAITVFAHAIRYLRNHFLKTLSTRTTRILEKDIQYILTVPAIWDETAKEFMCQAAREAGIANDQLRIALEPEAASVWCQVLTDHNFCDLSRPGSKYMVVDLGGGTADITVHEKLGDGSLKEIHKATGGAWGGTEVDKAYLQMLTDIFGEHAMEKIKKCHMEDYFDLLRDFETKKRNINTASEGKITFKVPASLRELAEQNGQSIEGRVKSSQYNGKIVVANDKLRMQRATAKIFFKKPIQLLISHVKDIFLKAEVHNVTAILLVGGFGESEIVKEAFIESFSDKSLYIPPEAGLAVLKGAVRFGHLPEIVSVRVSRFAYGREIWPDYKGDTHDKTKLHVTDDGRMVCKGVFQKMVDIGEGIPLGQKVYHRGSGLFVGQKTAAINVYTSTDSNVKYISEPSCKKIGQLIFDLPESSSISDLKHLIAFEFGDTKLNVHVTIEKTKKTFETFLNF